MSISKQYDITLKLDGSFTRKQILIPQYEYGITKFRIHVYIGKQRADLTDCTISAQFKKADQTFVLKNVLYESITQGIVYLILDQSLTNCAGPVHSSLEIINSDGKTYTSQFEYKVIEAVVLEDDVLSSDEMQTIDALRAEFNDYLNTDVITAQTIEIQKETVVKGRAGKLNFEGTSLHVDVIGDTSTIEIKNTEWGAF